MKAVVQDRYGPADEVLQLREVAEPAAGDDEVLVRVRATSVHADVWHVVSGLPYVLRLMGSGVRRPKDRIPGTDLAGVVEAVGRDVKGLKVGDEVFGESRRGFQWCNGCTFAEYVAVPEDVLALKPANVTFEEAASVPTAGIIVLLNLRDGAEVKPGQKVLVNGAGGGVGTIALQIAKAQGAEVTAVDRTDKLDMLRSAGADHAIDYTREDFTRSGGRYDLIFDIPGNHSFRECRRALTPSGLYVLIGHDNYGRAGRRVLGSLPRMMGLTLEALFSRQLPKTDFKMPPKGESMAVLKEYLETGKLKPVIDRTYPLSQVPEAMRYLQEGNVRGKVVISV